jgi:hypothetical protein
MSLSDIILIFIVPILSIIGFILNLSSTIVFSLIIKNGQRDDMYKYFLLKSICEMVGCGFSTFYAMYFNEGISAHTYMMTVWYVWFQNYIIKALFMASTGFEIADVFNCAISIEKKMKWCEKRLSFWIWVSSIVILSFGVEMYAVFVNTIKDFTYINHNNLTTAMYDESYRNLSPKMAKFRIAESFINEVFCLFILLFINGYILYKLIQIGRRKRRLTSKSPNNQNSNRAEMRKIIMIIVLFVTFLLGHLPYFVFYVSGHNYYSSLAWTNFIDYGTLFLYLSYSTSFFVFFFFNNIFRRLFLKIIHF